MRPFSLVLLLATLLAPFAHGAEEPDYDRAQELVRRGDRALLRGKREDADRLYRRALEVAEEYPAARLGLGHLALAEGRSDTAFLHYDAARRGYDRLGADLRSVESRRGEEAAATRRSLEDEREEVLQHLDRLEIEEPNPKRQERARLLAARLERIDHQVRQLDAVRPVASRAVPPDVFFHLGNALFRAGRVAEAVEAWETCADLAPDFGLVHDNLAVAYLDLGRVEDASALRARARAAGVPLSPRVESMVRERSQK